MGGGGGGGGGEGGFIFDPKNDLQCILGDYFSGKKCQIISKIRRGV